MGRGKRTEYEEKDILEKIDPFREYIESTEYGVAPTFTEFAKFIGIPVPTLRGLFRHLSEEAHQEFKDMRTDLLVAGALAKKYEKTITIFCLKNWSGWADKVEQTVQAETEIATKEEATEALKGLYGGKKVKEINLSDLRKYQKEKSQ